MGSAARPDSPANTTSPTTSSATATTSTSRTVSPWAGRSGVVCSSEGAGIPLVIMATFIRPMSLSRSPDFAKLWSGYTIAVIGSQITVLALPLTAILLLGASATETGLLVAARMAPALGLGLVIGAWVDRLPRRPIMIVSDIGSAIVIGSVPAAAALGVLGLPQLYAVAFVAGVFALATESARTALVPTLVGRDQLVAANSRLQGSSAVAQVAGPSLAGLLVQALTAPTAMLFDALTFLASAALLARVRVRETVAPRAADSRVWHE